MGHRWELEKRHNSKDVVDNNEGEESEEKWTEAQELVSDDLFAKILTDEGINGFANELEFARNDRGFT